MKRLFLVYYFIISKREKKNEKMRKYFQKQNKGLSFSFSYQFNKYMFFALKELNK